MYLKVSLENTGIDNPTVENVQQFLTDNRITEYAVVTSVSQFALIEAEFDIHKDNISELFEGE